MIGYMGEQPESVEITRSPDIMSGAAVFTRTRVPVKTMFDYLEAGETLDTFLDDFPSVSRKQALRVLHDAEAAVAGRA